MSPDHSFADLMARLRAGDEAAAAAIHQRFVDRLLALAGRQLEARLGARARPDREDVVQSVFGSFFERYRKGQFALGDWGAVWGLLALLTVRKCGRRCRALAAQRRGGRGPVVGPATGADPALWAEAVCREPTPDEAAMLAETVERWFAQLEPEERGIVELGLQGCSDPEVAERLRRSERTVRRVRRGVEDRLLRLIADGADDRGPGPAARARNGEAHP